MSNYTATSSEGNITRAMQERVEMLKGSYARLIDVVQEIGCDSTFEFEQYTRMTRLESYLESRAARSVKKPCVEMLPATKSSKHSNITWTASSERAGCGHLVISVDRIRVEYLVCEFGSPWPGRSWHFAKVTPGSDKTSAAEDVFIGRNGQDRQCSCRGYAYGKGAPCKHVCAALALLENGWV